MERRNANICVSVGFLADQLRLIHDTCNRACIHYLEMFTEDCKRGPVPEDRRRIMEMYETVGASDSLLENARTVDTIHKLTGTARCLDPRQLSPDLLGLPFPVDLIVAASIIREAYENPDKQHDVLYGLFHTGYIMLDVLLGFPKKADDILRAAENAFTIDVNLLKATIDKMIGRGQIIPAVNQQQWGNLAMRFRN